MIQNNIKIFICFKYRHQDAGKLYNRTYAFQRRYRSMPYISHYIYLHKRLFVIYFMLSISDGSAIFKDIFVNL